MDWNVIVSLFNSIIGGVDWLANLFVVLITVYGFWRAFITKRVSVISIYSNNGRDGANEVIMLKNYALREIYISDAYLIYDNKYAIHLASWKKEPYVLKANGVSQFETNYYSQLAVSDDIEVRILTDSIHSHICLRTSEGIIIHAPFRKKYKIKKKAKIKKITIIREYYYDKIVAPKCQYILHCKRKGEEAKIIQIWSSGVMSESLIRYDNINNDYSYFNGIPESAMNSITELHGFFNEIFKPFKMDFVQLIERKIDEYTEKKSSLNDAEEVTYRDLRPNAFSYEKSGFRTETTS